MKTRPLILTALFAALTAVGAFLRIPFPIAPITLQVFFTAMAGVLLGPRYGALSQLVYIVLGLIGLPVFTAGGGIAYVFQPTFGFLLALIPAAWLIGRMTENRCTPRRVALASAAGFGLIYLIGVPYMYLILNLYLGREISPLAAVESGMLLFLPGDAVKALCVAFLCPRIRRSLKGLSL